MSITAVIQPKPGKTGVKLVPAVTEGAPEELLQLRKLTAAKSPTVGLNWQVASQGLLRISLPGFLKEVPKNSISARKGKMIGRTIFVVFII
jgi:hypothetical protein